MLSCKKIAKLLFLGLLNLCKKGLRGRYDVFHTRSARYVFVFLNLLVAPVLLDTIAIVHAEVDTRSLMKIYKVAIFPLDSQSMSVEHASFISSAVKHALLREDPFEVIAYASDKEVQKGKEVIDSHHKKMWYKENPVSERNKLDTVYISQIGKELKIDLMIMYSIGSNLDTTSYIYIYIIDVRSEKQHYTKETIESFHSSTLGTQGGFDAIIKLTRRVFSDYKRDYLPHIQVVERQRRKQVQQPLALVRDHPHQDLLIAERQRQEQPQPLVTPWLPSQQEQSTDREQRPDAAEQVPKRYALTLRVTPPDSTVDILDTDIAYRPGMTLVPGRYDVKITRAGYKSVRRSVTIQDADVTLPITLERVITPTDVVPPTILITSHDPTRDVHVHTSATRSTIWGRVTDPSGVATVTVNGIQTVLDPEGNFGIDVALNEKVNPIVVTAEDTHHNVARTTFTIRRVMGVGPALRRTALVIGNAAYPTAPLRNPINDASDLAGKLEGLGFVVTLLQNATHRQMENAVDSFSRQLHGGGVGLFYYAGHGVQLEGQNYLIPVDATLAEDVDVKYEAVHASWVLERMESADNELNLVILDACRDNPFGRRWRLVQRGLAVIQAAQGTLIAYATAPGGVALDGQGRNGVYTKHLLRYITEPEWAVEQMFKQVRIAVVRETRGKQTPWESSSLLGDFYFAKR